MSVAIAYFNLGASYEHIQEPKSALQAYKTAKDISVSHLGETHALSIAIIENLEIVDKKQRFNETMHIMRDFKRREQATSKIYQNTNQNLLNQTKMKAFRSLNVSNDGNESVSNYNDVDQQQKIIAQSNVVSRIKGRHTPSKTHYMNGLLPPSASTAYTNVTIKKPKTAETTG